MALFPVLVAAALVNVVSGYVIGSEGKDDEVPNNITWSEEYHIKGERVYVTAGVVEPFELWYDGILNVSRKDVYNSTVRYFYDFSTPCVKTLYVHPETDSDLNVTTKCSSEVMESKYFKITSGFLPEAGKFEYKESKTYQSKDIKIWQWIEHDEVHGQTRHHEMYVTRDDEANDVPVRYSVKSFNKHEGIRSYIITNYFEYEPTVDMEIYSIGVTECSVMFTYNKELEDDEIDFDLDTTFHGYKIRHGIKYKDEEHETRKEIFKNNVKYIMKHNRQELSYKLGVNKFADRSDEEIAGMSCLLPWHDHEFPQQSEGIEENLGALDIPEEFDMRSHGKVTPVKNQLQCGSCWAFATTATIEVALAMRSPNATIELSEQSLIDCSWSEGNSGCNGGQASFALQFIKKYSIPTDQDYGIYKEQDDICHLNAVPASNRYKIKSWGQVSPRNITAFQHAVFKYGAIAVSIFATKNLLLYAGGLFYDTECADRGTNHAVTVVGYGVENNTTYWLVKNSWGAEWGEAGYVRFSATDNNCQLMNRGYYVDA